MDDIRRPPTEMYTHPEIVSPDTDSPEPMQSCLIDDVIAGDPCPACGGYQHPDAANATLTGYAGGGKPYLACDRCSYTCAVEGPFDTGGVPQENPDLIGEAIVQSPLHAIWDERNLATPARPLNEAYDLWQEHEPGIAARMADAAMDADRHRTLAHIFKMVMAAAILAIAIVFALAAIERYGMPTILGLYIVGIIGVFLGLFARKA